MISLAPLSTTRRCVRTCSQVSRTPLVNKGPNLLYAQEGVDEDCRLMLDLAQRRETSPLVQLCDSASRW